MGLTGRRHSARLERRTSKRRRGTLFTTHKERSSPRAPRPRPPSELRGHAELLASLGREVAPEKVRRNSRHSGGESGGDHDAAAARTLRAPGHGVGLRRAQLAGTGVRACRSEQSRRAAVTPRQRELFRSTGVIRDIPLWGRNRPGPGRRTRTRAEPWRAGRAWGCGLKSRRRRDAPSSG